MLNRFKYKKFNNVCFKKRLSFQMLYFRSPNDSKILLKIWKCLKVSLYCWALTEFRGWSHRNVLGSLHLEDNLMTSNSINLAIYLILNANSRSTVFSILSLKYNFLIIKFQNSVRWLRFLCCLPHCKIGWINP